MVVMLMVAMVMVVMVAMETLCSDLLFRCGLIRGQTMSQTDYAKLGERVRRVHTDDDGDAYRNHRQHQHKHPFCVTTCQYS